MTRNDFIKKASKYEENYTRGALSTNPYEVEVNDDSVFFRFKMDTYNPSDRRLAKKFVEEAFKNSMGFSENNYMYDVAIEIDGDDEFIEVKATYDGDEEMEATA